MTAAIVAGVSPSQVYQWCGTRQRPGRLPNQRLGALGARGKIIIDVADLEAFLNANKVGAGTASDDDEPLQST